LQVCHLDTVLTGLDSVVNYLQYLEPAGALSLQYLPPAIQDLLATPQARAATEKWITSRGWGLRLRIAAMKPH
jgi:hypothetical protein